MPCCKNCGIITLFSCGGILLVACIVTLTLWPTIFLNILKSQLVLTNTSKSYELWRETPIPMYLELFVYNFTNSKEVLNNPDKVKPHFAELGPYVFKERNVKVNKLWHENGTLTYQQNRTWVFQPEMSNGSLSDEATNINTIIAAVGNMGRDLPLGIKALMNVAIEAEESLIITKNVSELLFCGYDDNLIKLAEKYAPFIKLPFDKFGWFYKRNGTASYDGTLSIFTGSTDIDKLGYMDLWNYKKHVSMYDGDCGLVKGGTGELFPPQYKPDNVTVFAPDVCSAITLKQAGDITVHDISGSLFVGDDSVFDNGHKYPEGKCFCSAKSCAPYGGRYVGKCKFGAPAYVTFPHFYLADPIYASRVDGIVPNKEQDEFRLGLEVFTGIPLLVRAQLQINLLIERIPGFRIFKKLPDKTYFPMIWFRQEVKLTEEYARDARLALMIPQIIEGILYALLVIGALLVTGGVYIVVRNSRRNVESQSLITEEVSPDDSQRKD